MCSILSLCVAVSWYCLNHSVIARLITFKVHTGRGFAALVLLHLVFINLLFIYFYFLFIYYLIVIIICYVLIYYLLFISLSSIVDHSVYTNCLSSALILLQNLASLHCFCIAMSSCHLLLFVCPKLPA